MFVRRSFGRRSVAWLLCGAVLGCLLHCAEHHVADLARLCLLRAASDVHETTGEPVSESGCLCKGALLPPAADDAAASVACCPSDVAPPILLASVVPPSSVSFAPFGADGRRPAGRSLRIQVRSLTI